MVKERSSNWGGTRKGAGRKREAPENAKRRSIQLTDEEYKLVQALLKEKRSAGADK